MKGKHLSAILATATMLALSTILATNIHATSTALAGLASGVTLADLNASIASLEIALAPLTPENHPAAQAYARDLLASAKAVAAQGLSYYTSDDLAELLDALDDAAYVMNIYAGSVKNPAASATNPAAQTANSRTSSDAALVADVQAVAAPRAGSASTAATISYNIPVNFLPSRRRTIAVKRAAF